MSARATKAAGWPKYDRLAVGMLTQTLVPIRNGNMLVAAGTPVTIDGTYNGRFHIEGRPCSCCQVQVYVRNVARSSLAAPLADGPEGPEVRRG